MAEGWNVAVELEWGVGRRSKGGSGSERSASGRPFHHVWVGAELMRVPVESMRCVGVLILTIHVRKGNWNVSEMDS